MSRRTRLTAAVAMVIGLTVGGATTADAIISTQAQPNTWFCLDLEQPPSGICIENPLQGLADKGGLVGILLQLLQG